MKYVFAFGLTNSLIYFDI